MKAGGSRHGPVQLGCLTQTEISNLPSTQIQSPPLVIRKATRNSQHRLISQKARGSVSGTCQDAVQALLRTHNIKRFQHQDSMRLSLALNFMFKLDVSLPLPQIPVISTGQRSQLSKKGRNNPSRILVSQRNRDASQGPVLAHASGCSSDLPLPCPCPREYPNLACPIPCEQHQAGHGAQCPCVPCLQAGSTAVHTTVSEANQKTTYEEEKKICWRRLDQALETD